MTASVVPFSAVAQLDLVAALAEAQGQLAPSSRRMYRIDAEQFAAWMIERGLTPKTLTRSNVIAYRAYLQQTYRKATAERKLVVTRRILDELVIREVLRRVRPTRSRGSSWTMRRPMWCSPNRRGRPCSTRSISARCWAGATT